MTYGCAPTDGVAAKSPIVKSYLDCTKKWLNRNGGVLVMPAAMRYFKSDYVKGSTDQNSTTQELVYDITLAAV